MSIFANLFGGYNPFGGGTDPSQPPPGGLLDGGSRMPALYNGLLSAGGAMLAGGDPRYPQGFGQALGRGFLGLSQGLNEGALNSRRNRLADQQIQYQGAEMDALKAKTALAQRQMEARQRISANLMGGGTPQGGQASMGGAAPQSGQGASMPMGDTSMGGTPDTSQGGGMPGWDAYVSAAAQSLAANDDDGAQRYLEMAKALPGYDAAKARALIAVKVDEQQALMPGKVQEAGLTAGADAGARLPYQKNLAGYDSGLALNRALTQAQFNKKLELEYAGPVAAATAAAQAGSPVQMNTNAEKLRDDFRSDKNVIAYQTVVPIYTSMQDSLKRPGGAADLNLVYGLAKIMDPGSVVREGETWMVRDTSNLPQEIQGLIGKVTNGQRLPDELRQSLVAEAGSRVAAYKQSNDAATQFYANQAKFLKLDPSKIIYDVTPPAAPGQPKPLSDDELIQKYGARTVR